MKFTGTKFRNTWYVYPLIAMALSLVLACGTTVPAAQESVVDETAPVPAAQESVVDETAPVPAAQESVVNETAPVPAASSEANAEPVNTRIYPTFAPYVPREKPTPTPGFSNSGNKVGDPIPDFTITLVDGTAVTSVELLEQRQPTFLFFFETWCGTCRRELALMNEVYPEFENDVDLYVIGATPVDSLATLEEFRLEQGYTWPMAGAEVSILRDFNVAIRSTKIAFDANGIITYRATFGQANEDVWREVFAELVASKS